MTFKDGDLAYCLNSSITIGFTRGKVYQYKTNQYSHSGSFTCIDDKGSPNGYAPINFIHFGSIITDLERILYNIDKPYDKC